MSDSSQRKRVRTHAQHLTIYTYMAVSQRVLRRLIPDNRLKLGLDLKGGVHLVLEVDLETSKTELLREHVISIPERLRTEDVLCREVKQIDGQDTLDVFVGIPSRTPVRFGRKSEVSGKSPTSPQRDRNFLKMHKLVPNRRCSPTYQLIRSVIEGIQKYSEQAISTGADCLTKPR